MEYWQRNIDGKRFDCEEDAYLDFLKNEDIVDLEDWLLNAYEGLNVRYLLHWAMGQDGFWEAFDEDIAHAREEMFEEYYSNWEEPDEGEECPHVEYHQDVSMTHHK